MAAIATLENFIVIFAARGEWILQRESCDRNMPTTENFTEPSIASFFSLLDGSHEKAVDVRLRLDSTDVCFPLQS